MSWYYSDNGRQAGPVDDAGLDGLIRLGAVKPDTLVWKEGMANWQPLSTVRPAPAPDPVPAPPPPPPAPVQQQSWAPPSPQQPQAYQPQQSYQPAVAAGASAGGVTCANCGQMFSPNDVIFLGNSYVCEGGAAAGVGVRRFGGFWIRFAAVLIDGVILGIASYAITLPVTFTILRLTDNPMAVVGVSLILNLLQIGLAAAYTGYFLSTKGATPGKMVLGLQVIRSDGSGLTFTRGACRYLAQIVSAMILAIGYIIAAFDNERRTLHDHLCDTRVVYK
jgi:uncharacterized RDD family membrane protein YckC